MSGAIKVVYLKNETQQWDQYTKTQMDSKSNQVATDTQKESQREEDTEENDDEDIANGDGVGSIHEARIYIHDCQSDPLNWWHLVLKQYLFLLRSNSFDLSLTIRTKRGCPTIVFAIKNRVAQKNATVR